MEIQGIDDAASAVALGIADEVRAELARQRRSGAELAVVLGLTQQTVGRRLNGVTPFDVLELARAVAWLGTTVPELTARVTSRVEAVAS